MQMRAVPIELLFIQTPSMMSPSTSVYMHTNMLCPLKGTFAIRDIQKVINSIKTLLNRKRKQLATPRHGKSYRSLHIGFLMVPKSLTSDNLERSNRRSKISPIRRDRTFCEFFTLISQVWSWFSEIHRPGLDLFVTYTCHFSHRKIKGQGQDKKKTENRFSAISSSHLSITSLPSLSVGVEWRW